jgi:hypothetical protein
MLLMVNPFWKKQVRALTSYKFWKQSPVIINLLKKLPSQLINKNMPTYGCKHIEQEHPLTR